MIYHQKTPISVHIGHKIIKFMRKWAYLLFFAIFWYITQIAKDLWVVMMETCYLVKMILRCIAREVSTIFLIFDLFLKWRPFLCEKLSNSAFFTALFCKMSINYSNRYFNNQFIYQIWNFSLVASSGFRTFKRLIYPSYNNRYFSLSGFSYMVSYLRFS